MEMKRIICLILVAVTLLGIVASGIAIMVNAADTTTVPTESTVPGDSTGNGNGGLEMKNGDKIVVFILGAIVPCIIFIVMIVKVTWGKK